MAQRLRPGPNVRAVKFGIFYEHQLPRPWDERQRVPAPPASRSTRSSWPTGSATTTPGRSSTTSSRSTRTPRRPRCSSPPPASAPNASASATASSSSRPTTRPGSPSGCRPSTCVSDGRVELGIGEGSTTTELHPFDRRFRDKREVWEDAVRALIPMFGDEAVEYHGEHFDFPLRNVLPKPLPEAAPAAVGRVLPARHDRGGRPVGHGRARLPVRERRRGPRVGGRLLQRLHQAARRASPTTPPTRTSPWCAGSCAARPTRRRTSRPTAGRSSPSPCATTPPVRPDRSGRRA